MKKLFLLIPALVLALAMNAEPIGPNDPNVTVNNVIAEAVSNASANAVIELSNGIYQEDGNFAINKNITIKAAEGAHPVIAQRYYIYFNNSAQVTFKGIKFDGGIYGGNVGAYDHALRTYGTTAGDETLTLDDCEFANYPSYVIFVQRANRRLNTITISNCYFHNNVKYAIYIGKENGDTQQSCNALTITNTTFANVTGSYDVIYYEAPDEQHTTSLNVDHCTFYNHPKRAIFWQQSSNLTVSNCIFAQPASVSYKSVECVGGNITNCLTYNTGGYSSAANQQGCITGDPYFTNTQAGNYDFTVASFSPAHNAGTDGENLGDLNWASDPSLHPTKQNITAAANSLSAAVKAAWPGDTIVLASGTYSEAEVVEFNKSLVIMAAAEANPVIAQHYYSKVTSGADVQFIGIKFDGSIYPANDYCFYPFDNTDGNELHFEKCEFVGFNSYVLYDGGAYSLDSLIVNNCFFHNNKKSSVIYFNKHTTEGKQTVKGVKVTNSTFANNATSPSYSVIFICNQTATEVPDVEVTVDHCTFYNNPTTDSDHASIRSYKSTKVAISNCIFAHPEAYERRATACYGGTISNCLTYNLTSDAGRHGHRQSSGKPALSGNFTGAPLFVDAANNNFAMRNASVARREDGSVWGDPRWVTAIQPVAIPAKLNAMDAIVSDTAGVIPAVTVGAPDSITFKLYPGGNYSYEDREWAKWKVSVSKTGYYNFTAHVFRASGSQKFEIKLFNSDETSELIAHTDESISSGEKTISTGQYELVAGNTYVVKVRNLYNWSKSNLLFVEATYEGGALVNIPVAALPFEDAILSEKATRNLETTPQEIHFGSPNASQYAKWNVHATAGLYDFTIDFVGTNHGIYQLDITDSNNQSVYSESKGKTGSASLTYASILIPTEGNYVIQMANTNPGADGYLTGFAATTSSVADVWVINESETTASDIEDHDNVQWKPMLVRTFHAGVYNSICVPFDSYDSELKNIFGEGYELLAMESATLEGSVLMLNFAPVAGNDFAAGVPYLIKPTQEVVNPTFSKHTIHNYTSNNTVSGVAANFIGTFVKQEIAANPNNLYLGTDNKLYFSNSNVNIKGLRAYFKVNISNAQQVIKNARIVKGTQVITDVKLVEAERNATKAIENGQLIITIDGVRYNVMGTKLQ